MVFGLFSRRYRYILNKSTGYLLASNTLYANRALQKILIKTLAVMDILHDSLNSTNFLFFFTTALLHSNADSAF